jgi:crossover junction endodeoxyribonuclease RuvC
MTVLGIDLGLAGALAFLNDSGGLTLHDMPTLKIGSKGSIDEIELARIIDAHPHRIDVAVVELVSAMPGQGVTSMFNFGYGAGLVRGILRANFIPVEVVTPATWKRRMGIKSGAGKDASLAMAKALFQQEAGMFARVKDNGRADATLLAVYGAKHVRR